MVLAFCPKSGKTRPFLSLLPERAVWFIRSCQCYRYVPFILYVWGKHETGAKDVSSPSFFYLRQEGSVKVSECDQIIQD
jgi:hypothetical protein